MTYGLSTEQIEFYRENHYLHARHIIPNSVLELSQTILQRWVDETVSQWHASGLITDTRTDIDFQHRLVHLWNAAGKPKYNRSPRRDLVSREMFDFLSHPALLKLAEDLIGTTEISAHGIFNARPKLPDQKWTDTPWHQDAQYYRDAENTHVLSMWIPLQEVTEKNSCLQVAPGFFVNELRQGEVDEESGFLGLTKEDSKLLKGISIEMEPGDVLCFDQLMPHRALSNLSGAVRWSMDLRYEATATATESGKKQGFVAQSFLDPASVETYEQWLEKWNHIPAGSY